MMRTIKHIRGRKGQLQVLIALCSNLLSLYGSGVGRLGRTRAMSHNVIGDYEYMHARQSGRSFLARRRQPSDHARWLSRRGHTNATVA